jgi:phosphoglycerate kinase
MENKKTVRDVNVKGKRVFVRVDFNVPIDERTGKILDTSRIVASLPTINYLLYYGAKVVLCSHLGRPDGKPNEKYSLRPVVSRLAGMLGQAIVFTNDCVGADVEQAVSWMNNGDVLLMENVRFHPEEEEGDPVFARALSNLADVYVDDAFATAHRKHASIVGITKYLPSVAGLLLEKELATLGTLIKDPEHPFASVLGGAKVSDKVKLMENIFNKVDMLLVGGGMAATFLKAKGYEIGLSMHEADRLEVARAMEKKANGNGQKLILPVDVVVTDDISDKGTYDVVTIDKVTKDKKIVDIGPETEKLYAEKLGTCRIIFWNGPMGVHEIPQFAHGTRTLAEFIAQVNAKTIIGGGSTAEVVTNMGLASRMGFVSTGGGASMSYLSGDKLPGVVALQNK